MESDYTTSGRQFVSNVMGQAIPPKKLRHCCGVVPVLRNVPLPFWGVSTFPNTIFGIGGVKESRRRVRVAIAYYVSVIKQTSLRTKTMHHCIQHQKRARSRRWVAWKITGKVYGKLTQPGMNTVQQNKSYEDKCDPGYFGLLISAANAWLNT